MKAEVMAILQEMTSEMDRVVKTFEASFMAGPGVTSENTAAYINGKTKALIKAAEAIDAFYQPEGENWAHLRAQMEGMFDKDPFDCADDTATDKRERDADAKADADNDKARAGE